MIKQLAGACVVAFALLAPALYAQEVAKIESFHLPNGMEVIVIPNHRVPAVSHTVWFRVGAADDPPGKSGLAHYHEHTMFLGSTHYKAGEFANTVMRSGGEENAFTGTDATAYYINIAKDQLPLAMELEADRMRGLVPSDKDMEKEKQVIIEERRMRIENEPQALLAEQINAALWRNHPYHRPVIGWMSEMEGLTKEDVLAFHRAYYHPNNAILIISGDVTAAEVKPLAEKYYGSLPNVATPPRVWGEEPPQNNARRIVMHHKNVKQPVWSRSYAAPSLGYGRKELALPLFLLSQLVGEGKNSRLYKSLVVEQKLATEVESDYNGFSLGPAEFSISITPEKNVDFAMLEKAVDKEIAGILKDGFTDRETARGKTLLEAESIYAREGLSSMGRIMGWIRIVGLPTDYFLRWPKLIEAVSKDQVIEAARETLKLDQSVTATLLPEEGAP
jgi:zinc protease